MIIETKKKDDQRNLEANTAACALEITCDPALLLSASWMHGEVEVTKEEIIFTLIYGGPTVCAHLDRDNNKIEVRGSWQGCTPVNRPVNIGKETVKLIKREVFNGKIDGRYERID